MNASDITLTVDGTTIPVKSIDCEVTVGEKVNEPMYYDERYFKDWGHTSNGWSPAEGEDCQRTPSNDTSVNRFHLHVQNFPYHADLYDGPHTQEVRVWTGGYSFGEADRSEIVRCPTWPYVCFIAILQEPERFLPEA